MGPHALGAVPSHGQANCIVASGMALLPGGIDLLAVGADGMPVHCAVDCVPDVMPSTMIPAVATR